MPTLQKKCIICGNAFVPKSTNGKYCSPGCIKEAKMRRERVLKPAGEEEAPLHTCDKPEVMAVCLECRRPSCKHGECDKIAEAIKAARKKKAKAKR